MVRPNVRAMAGYVPGEQPRGGDFVKLNTNESPYPPSPCVFEAVRAALTGDVLRKYPDPFGTEFRRVAAAHHGVEPDMILIGNGSDDILTILTRTFVPEGGLIASPTPSYLLYGTLAALQGARFESVPFTSDWSLSTPWPVRGAHLTLVANPNSPSGTVVPPCRLAEFAEELIAPLVIDEAYVDFAAGDALPLLAKRNVIVTRSLSKSYGLAGLRFGYALADAALIREMTKVKDSYNCDVLSLAAAAAAVADQAYLATTLARIRAGRLRLTEFLRQRGFAVTPSHANFVWSTHPEMPVKLIYERLKERQILVRYMSYDGYGDGLRITVGSDRELDRLETALSELT